MSKREPYEYAPRHPARAPHWTSFDELEVSEEKRAQIAAEGAKEFPAGASELTDPVSRRAFMGVMGASVALATMEGCRRPLEHIVPYTHMPENVIPGVPTHYATVVDRNGEALGLLVESHEGRPTKIDGNPDHPASAGGGADMIAQASVLDLYDPDRSRQPSARGINKLWPEFDAEFEREIAGHVETGGRGLHILAEPSISPTFVRLRELVQRRFPNARFHTYSAVPLSARREGARLAFGAPVNALHAYDEARVILSLDADFLGGEPGMVHATRAFANGRRLQNSSGEMSRLYQIESGLSVTGGNADHRLRLPSRDVEAYLLALANKLAVDHHLDLGEVGGVVQGRQPPAGVPAQWLDVVAAELASNRTRSVVVAGSRQPATVHALAHALNAALENVGHTVVYAPVADGAEPEQVEDIRGLTDAMASGRVQTLVILGGNPVYDCPGDLDFAGKLGQVRTSIHLSMFRDETSERATWHAPRAHYLETWGDQAALDGTVAIQQPLIAPLYAGRSDIEILAVLADVPSHRGHDLVRETFRGEPIADLLGTSLGRASDPAPDALAATFERTWRRALNRGVVTHSAPVPMSALAPRYAAIAEQLRARNAGSPIGRDNLEVVFVPDSKLFDGRHANNAWLVEMPEPLSKIVWDNAAYLSPTTAHELGIENGEILELGKDRRTIRIVAWIMPGYADFSIALPLGWGRTRAGRIGNGKGFDVNPLRSSQAIYMMDGVELTKTGERYRVVQTQEHFRMEGHLMERRPLALQATLEEYRHDPYFAEEQSPTPRTLPLWRGVEYNGHKWGMVIDLNACTGCNACAIACQAENNVPVVGKDQVYRGREMHWLRVDRYYIGDDVHDPGVIAQPVMCVQCENAPCENVCPVNATTHSPEGLNDMAYNRCIGTRYCANNCPYKVRRFNYLNWHNDGPYQPQDADVPETLRMQHNPNVTVRFRGVMEKCTYCVQRIQTAKIAAKRENRPIHDGEIVTACQQTCPAGAITFGDLNDDRARIWNLSRNDRGYRLLGEVGTRPRTMHLARIRNPNPEMHG